MRITKILLCMIFTALITNAEDAKLKEPKYMSEKPEHVKLQLINKEIINFVIDESKGTGTGYDELYIDRNLNSNLIDDNAIKSVTCLKFKGREETAFRNIKLESKDINYEFNVIKMNWLNNDESEKVNNIPKVSIIIGVKALMTDKDEKWEYLSSAVTSDNKDINKEKNINVFNEKLKLAVNTTIFGLREKNIYVKMVCFDENNKSAQLPQITKNTKQISPVLVIENEKGEKISSAYLESG